MQKLSPLELDLAKPASYFIAARRKPESRDTGKFQYLFGVIQLEMDDAAPDTDCHGLRAVRGAKFLHDVLDMDLHGFF